MNYSRPLKIHPLPRWLGYDLVGPKPRSGPEMGGIQNFQGAMFSYISLEERIPKRHLARKLRDRVSALLATMSRDFETVDSKVGPALAPPEILLKALLPQILFSMRLERLLV